MKPKYIGLIILLVSLLALGGFNWMEVQSGRQNGRSSGMPHMAPITDFKVPNAAELEKMDRLERSMSFLVTPISGKQSRTDLSAFGYIPMDTSVKKGGKNGIPEAAAETYRITLAFEGRYRRYCLIDGHLLTEGNVLPDGAFVVKIESDRVLISKRNTQQWLDVEPLFQSVAQEES